MLYRMVIWRLCHFADECQLARQLAIDPMTRKELEQFEKLFQQSALENRDSALGVDGLARDRPSQPADQAASSDD